MVDLCVRCGFVARDFGNDKCLECFQIVDPVGYQQTIDHRRRKAERAEAERLAQLAKKKQTTTPYAIKLMEEMMRKRELGLPSTRIGPFCNVCENRGEIKVPSVAAGPCEQCKTRHLLSLQRTGLPDMTRGPRFDENHFPPEAR